MIESAPVSGSTSLPEVLLKRRASGYVRIVNFLEQHISQNYADRIKEDEATPNPLMWFFDTCSVEMIKEVAVAYGTTIEPQNERVKRANGKHNAQGVIALILRFFKICINDRLTCKHSVQSLSSGQILRQITNKRIQLDEQLRRTFTDEEVESLFAVATCKKDTLILTILYEVGLRASAIEHPKYYMLLDPDHTSRDLCSVPEKGGIRHQPRPQSCNQGLLRRTTGR
jgi:integrase